MHCEEGKQIKYKIYPTKFEFQINNLKFKFTWTYFISDPNCEYPDLTGPILFDNLICEYPLKGHSFPQSEAYFCRIFDEDEF